MSYTVPVAIAGQTGTVKATDLGSADVVMTTVAPFMWEIESVQSMPEGPDKVAAVKDLNTRLEPVKTMILAGKKFDGDFSKAVLQLGNAMKSMPNGVIIQRVAFVQNAAGKTELALVGYQKAGGGKQQNVMLMSGGGTLNYDRPAIPDGRAAVVAPRMNGLQMVPISKPDAIRLDVGEYNKSFAPEVRLRDDAALAARLNALGAPRLAASLDWSREEAGVFSVENRSGVLTITGARTFRTLALADGEAGRPTDRQEQFVAAMNVAWNNGGDVLAVAAAYADALPTNVSGETLLKAEAFSTSAGVAVLDKTYRSVTGAFVPFHTHLGHPESFHGLAQHAPTAADVWSHRALMNRTGQDLSVPGVILHSDGTVTAFWAGRTDRSQVVFETLGGQTGRTSVTALFAAEFTGELSVCVEGDAAVSGERGLMGKAMPVWDRRLFAIRKDEDEEGEKI